MKPFTITSTNNAVAVAIYAMLAFAGFMMVLGPSRVISIESVNPVFADMFAMLLFMCGSAAVYATLSAPKRRDIDTSLAIEFWSCVSLCTLMCGLELSLLFYRSPSGAFLTSTFGFGLIFLVAFFFRARQIKHERKAVRAFRDGPNPG